MAKKKTAAERAAERRTVLYMRFAAAYVSNGRNAAQAYLLIHPRVTAASAATLGGTMLRNVEVDAEIRRLTNEVWKREHMSADEVLGRMARIANQNIRDYYWQPGELNRAGEATTTGQRKPLSELTEAQTECIKGYKFSATGLVIQEHYDKTAQLSNIAKFHKLLSDNVNVNLTMSLEQMIQKSYEGDGVKADE